MDKVNHDVSALSTALPHATDLQHVKSRSSAHNGSGLLFSRILIPVTRALLRLERTLNLLCHQREGGEGRVGEGRGGWGVRGGRGGSTVIHILMAPQYLNSNHVTYYVIT